MTEVLEIPTLEEQKTAKATLDGMKQTNPDSHPKVFISYGEGSSFAIPQRMIKYLTYMLSSMADGKGFRLIMGDEDLSSQEAADILHVSRPFLIKLLEQGQIPFQKVGKHRRVKLKDLHAYEERQQALRNQQLDYLAQQAQELNMGY